MGTDDRTEHPPYLVYFDPSKQIPQGLTFPQLLYLALPSLCFYWGEIDYYNSLNAQSTAARAPVEAQPLGPRPPITELLGFRARRAAYTIEPVPVSQEEWRKEALCVSIFGGSIAWRESSQRSRNPVTPYFETPVLRGQRLHTRAPVQRDSHPKPARMIPRKSTPIISPSELRNIQLLKQERDALQRRLADQNRGGRGAQRHELPSRSAPSRPSASASSSRNLENRRVAERSQDYPELPSPSSSSHYSSSAVSSRAPGSTDDDESDSGSESASQEWQSVSWASQSVSSGSGRYSRRLSPPPRRGERLMRMHHHQLSRETQRPGFLHSLMSALASFSAFFTNFWDAA